MSEINEKTRINLFAVMVLIPSLLGGMFWLTSIWAGVEEARHQVAKHELELSKQGDVLLDIRDRLTKIEEHLRRYR